MHKGFYTERDLLGRDMIRQKEINNLHELGFEFMEVDNLYDGISPYDFLHGHCFAFAKYPCETYGYKFCAIWDSYEDCLIHAFRVDLSDNYIDVRGIINDFKEFVDEFELIPEDIGYLEDYRYYIINDFHQSHERKEDIHLKSVAKQIDATYRYYQ